METEGSVVEPMPAGGDVQIAVKFTTKLPEPFRVEDAPLTVPGSLKRRGLSKVVNHLLATETPRPFDFVVEGKLLRTSLREHFEQRGLSVEGVIEIEYIPVILPPKTTETALHDDWVSAVHGRTSTLLTASYDGTVKGWTRKHLPSHPALDGSTERFCLAELKCLWSVGGHEHPITSVVSVPHSPQEVFLTGSQDFLVKAWIVVDGEEVPQPCATLTGHGHSVCSVCVSPDGERCCSVGWGEEIRIWPCGDALLDAEDESSERAKRQKRDPSPSPTLPVKSISSLGQLHGHQGCVADVTWPRKSSLLTAGWDHTIRKWNVQTGQSTETLTRSKVIHCLTTPPNNAAVVAFGSADAVLRLWDTRDAKEDVSLSLYRSHSNWIVSLSWSPVSDFHLATASHDGTVRVWDIRGSVPVATCGSHGDKCLAVDWCGEWAVASGGADCAVHSRRVVVEI